VVLDSTLGWNVATSGAEPAHGGAIHHAAGQLVVDGSTFHGNAARTTDSDALGGALATGGSGAPTAVTITRSTFHGNAAQGPNTADGGALHVDHASVSVAVTTISANQATRGPGVWLADRAAVRVDATILDHGGAPSCAGSVQPVAVPGDHNLAGDTACGFVGTGNRGGVASGLGPLGLDELVIVNGGSTPVRVPASDSPAVDAIAPGTVGLCDGTFPTDQRDRARPRGEGCDVGAVER
jgi:hypothetical protein